MASLYVALLHYPVYNIDGDIVATSLTALDLHDIARSCITYGVKGYYVVHPIPEMARLAEDILDYWQDGPGAMWRPNRREAFTLVRLTETLEEVLDSIKDREKAEPIVVATSARRYAGGLSYDRLAGLVRSSGPPILILFGTGHGLSQDIIDAADYTLHPIRGSAEYNHLSVRAAAAIILDRIVGEDTLA
jgi:hypothetical protein